MCDLAVDVGCDQMLGMVVVSVVLSMVWQNSKTVRVVVRVLLVVVGVLVVVVVLVVVTIFTSLVLPSSSLIL